MRKDISSATFTIIVLLCFLMSARFPGSSEASPSALSAEIQINETWEVLKEAGEDLVLVIGGAFILTERTGLDRLTPVTATLSVSDGQWDAKPRQTIYNDVGVDNWETFSIDMVIPEQAKSGQSSSYTVTIQFQGQASEITETAGFTVRLISISDDGPAIIGDDNGNGEDSSSGEGFPIWPVFLLGLIVIVVFVGLWAYRNLEIVREAEGRHKIYIREKDTGRIIGKDR